MIRTGRLRRPLVAYQYTPLFLQQRTSFFGGGDLGGILLQIQGVCRLDPSHGPESNCTSAVIKNTTMKANFSEAQVKTQHLCNITDISKLVVRSPTVVGANAPRFSRYR